VRAEIANLLERCGIPPGREGVAAGKGRFGPRAFDPLADPEAADQLGGLLADHARPVDPNVVVVWESWLDLLLGFAVARRLAVPMLRAFVSEGLIVHDGTLPDAPRAVLVGEGFTDRTVVSAVEALMHHRSGTLEGVFSVYRPDWPEPRPVVVSLVDRPAAWSGGARE
jgi:hypothetical protein